MSLTWTRTTAGLRGPVNGRYSHGEDDVYVINRTPGGMVILSRISAAHWAPGQIQGIVADVATTLTEVPDFEEGQRLAEMYEAGIDDPDRPAWQHVPAA